MSFCIMNGVVCVVMNLFIIVFFESWLEFGELVLVGNVFSNFVIWDLGV